MNPRADVTLRARGEIHQIVRGLHKLGGYWDGLQVAATPEQIGIRDGRRIRGRYMPSRLSGMLASKKSIARIQ